MANYRQIHVAIWKDEWFLELDPKEKLLFIYLFSNESTSLAGIYKIPLRVIAFETCLDIDFILATMQKFAEAGKAYYDSGVIWVVNMRRYHETRSPKVSLRIASDIAAIPDCKLKIRYLYGMDTKLQLKEEEKEYEYEKEEEKEDINAASAAPPPSPLSPGQRFTLDAFGAKRFRTNIQRDAVKDAEDKHGYSKLEEYVIWAARKGFSLGDTVSRMDSTLAKWGRPKPQQVIQGESEIDRLYRLELEQEAQNAI